MVVVLVMSILLKGLNITSLALVNFDKGYKVIFKHLLLKSSMMISFCLKDKETKNI